jgi:hypothetical protein
MAYQMKESERRTVMIGAFIALPILIFTYGVKPMWASITDKRDQLELERTTLVRERAAIAAAQKNPQLQQIADSLMKTARDRLFSGSDDVMASAELGSYIGEVASQNHFLLTSATTGAVSKTKSVVRTLSEDIRGESDLQGILEFVQALERGSKLVRISKIDLSRATRDVDDIETIVFAATITAYALPVEPASPMTNTDAKATASAPDSVSGGKP